MTARQRDNVGITWFDGQSHQFGKSPTCVEMATHASPKKARR
jgi:hypothetical protein